jgi:hypothetical protein
MLRNQTMDLFWKFRNEGSHVNVKPVDAIELVEHAALVSSSTLRVVVIVLVAFMPLTIACRITDSDTDGELFDPRVIVL